MQALQQVNDVTGADDERPADGLEVAAKFHERLPNELPLPARRIRQRPVIRFDDVEAHDRVTGLDRLGEDRKSTV